MVISLSTSICVASDAAKSAPAPAPARPQARQQPTHDQIARRAFEIYAGRGYTNGNHMQDWLQAERELNTQK